MCTGARADIVSGLGGPPPKRFAPSVQVASASSTTGVGDPPSPHVPFAAASASWSGAVSDEERRAALALDMLSSSSSSRARSPREHYTPFAPNPSANPRASSSSSWRAPSADCKYDDDDYDYYYDEYERIDDASASSSCTAMGAAHDPRIMQEAAGRALVSHELRVELADDLAFELRVTSESRCSSVVCKCWSNSRWPVRCLMCVGVGGVQAKCVHAEVPRLPLDEYSALLQSLRCGLLHATRPVSVEEQESVLPKRAPNAGVSVFESFAWVELSARRVISSLKLLGEFSALPLATQMQILKACFCLCLFFAAGLWALGVALQYFPSL